MKNKLMALLVLAIFVISLVPMAIAEEASDADTERETQSRSERNKEALERRIEIVEKKADLLERHKAQISRLISECENKGAEIVECKEKFENRLRKLESLPEDSKLRLAQFQERKERKKKELGELEQDKNFSKHKRELKFKARLINKAKLEDARKGLIRAKLEFKESNLKLDNAKLRLEEAKKLDKACKENNQSEDCKKAKVELLAAAKEHFISQADHIIKTLEKIKSRVLGSEDLSDEEETKLIAEIDAEVAKINDIKSRINSAQNKEELLKAAKELKEEWNKIRHQVKRFAAMVVGSRMSGIIVTSKHLEVKLDKVLVRMTENGKDISEVQPLVDEFHKEIELARTEFKDAQELWAKVKAGEDKNLTVQQAQDKLKEVREHLKKAREILWKIIQKMDKGALKEVEAENKLEVSAEADVSTSVNASGTSAAASETAESTNASAATSEATGTETTASTEASANASATSETTSSEATVSADASLQVTA